MRRFFIPFLFLVTAMMLIVALPAGAGKPDCSDPRTTHPPCDKGDAGDETLHGTVCDPDDYPNDLDGQQIVGVQEDDFAFTLSGKQDSACIDVVSVEGRWEVTITGDGARYLGVIPRDSISPGDSCGGYLLRSEGDIYGGEPLILGYAGFLPAATINACGVDFAEWVDFGSYGLDESYCLAYNDDGTMCEVAEKVDVTHPLVLQAFLRGSADPDRVTTFEVDLP